MVYLNISVKDFDSVVDFYSVKLGFFDAQSNTRLIFNIEPSLIIDLHEVGSEDHLEIFSTNDHVASSFWVHVGGDEQRERISILEKLKMCGVPYEETINLGGHYLSFVDPSGNKFALHAHNGIFE